MSARGGANDIAPRSRYLFDNSAPEAGARLAGLETLYDGVTRRHLDRLGIGAGWRCLEVGAGGGSVARFMSERVGATGHVLATDIDTDRIPRPTPANLELRRHDIGVDPLPQDSFDLVHARAVLAFVPEREAALSRMVAALECGGWLLVEELVPSLIEELDPQDDPDTAFVRKWRQALRELMRRTAGDPGFGFRLPRVVRAAGLVDVGAEGYFMPFRTAAVVALARANIDQTGGAILEAGLMTAAELDRYAAVLERSDCSYPVSLPLISVWGRRTSSVPNRGEVLGLRCDSHGEQER
ncbi:methyltransferase domain-containing protein [Rhodococcus koreensis]